MNKNKIKKVSRRTLSLAMLAAFTITLSGCSSNTNEYGNLDRDAIYSQAGSNYTVTNAELWDELKWSAVDSLTSQINNVIINDDINKVKVIMKNNYSGLSTDEAALFESEDEYNELYARTKDRLVDYVVQDVYNFTYSSSDYWDSLESVSTTDAKKLEEQYLDDMYLATKQTKIGDKEIADLIRNAGKDNYENYFTIAQAFPNIYYPSLAKENFALAKLQAEVAEDHESDDETSDIYGKYTKTQFASKYKTIYANQFNLNLVLIRFSSETEYNNTLRAFGLKIYNRDIYYIPGTANMTYDQYVKFYDDYTITTNDRAVVNLTDNFSEAVILQLYAEMYNYVYGGYRDVLSTGQTINVNVTSLNDLRTVTQTAYDKLGAATDDTINSMKQNLLLSTETAYTRDDLDKISTTFSTYLYETLLEDIDENDDVETLPYSTASQNYNDSYYIAYKFGEGEYSADGLNHKEIYDKDMTNDDIFDMLDDNNLLESIEFELIIDDLTETVINNYMSEALEDVNVKIYNEAIEIGYLVSNSEYSKTLSSLSDKNVLATITYNDRTWNFNLKANSEDSSSLLVAGTDETYGVFDELEASDGITTAVDILSTKIVKNTQAYADTNEDRDVYEDYIEAILYNFSNNSYSSSGYASSIGKYNFMMLYFHDVNIDNIIDNYYRVSSASSQLLTDYSSDELITLFKTYTDISYDNYFSMSGTRLVVFYDKKDDTEADETETWKENPVTFNFGEGDTPTTLGTVAKYLILEINNELSASTDSHATALSEIVTEINESGKVAYDQNPILSENTWAKYRYLGLNVKTEDYSCTNSSTDLDYTLKQRLYDYALGEGKAIINGTETSVEYQYYINDATPSEYIQPYTTVYNKDSDIVSLSNTEIIETTDGYNLIIVSSGTTTNSAKWTKDDNGEELLENIVVKYNDENITISDVYNEDDKLNANQIKLYILEYVTLQTSNLLPSSISDAITNYLTPVYERYTADATQRIILLYFIEQYAGSEITFSDTTKVTELEQIIEINKDIADDYSYIYNDTTNTSNNFTGWWDTLESLISDLIIKDGE